MRPDEVLDRLFNPQSVAVVGATNTKTSVGYALMRNLVGSGYEGVVYPVNPKRRSVFGIKAYPSVADIPDTVDMAVIATPASTVPAIVKQCGASGVRALTIITAGFLESGEAGRALFDEVQALAREYGIRYLGPNCLGFLTPSAHLNASFSNKAALPGNLAFISQSGALCTSVLDWSVREQVGFSHFVSIGSAGNIDFDDLIDYFGSDPHTYSILIYMESLKNAKRFLSAARAFARNKPIIVLKVGRSAAGAQAAMSHTGSLTGDDAIFDAAFERAGIIRVHTIGQLFNTAQTLAMQPRPRGNRLAIVTNAGGPGVIATDALMEQGGALATLSAETMQALNDALPGTWSHGNPVDVLGDAPAERYEKAVELCAADPNVDGVLTILTPQAMTDPAGVARALVALNKRTTKPLLASWMGADDIEEGRRILVEGRVPVYRIPESAVACFCIMYSYSRGLETLYETPTSIPVDFAPKTSRARKLIAAVADEGRSTLTEFESKKLLSLYGIPTAKHEVATSAREAGRIATKIGLPVAMKILSPDILHKTDVGGVRIGVESRSAAEKAFTEIMKNAATAAPKAALDGVLIEQMVDRKYELLIGCKKDPIFGPVIVFGLGGVAVEVFKDTNIGLPPLNMALSQRLIEDTKIFTLLKGYRGMQGIELKQLQFMLYKFAYLIMDFPEIAEIDINPYGIDHRGGVVLDAKVILDPKVLAQPVAPFSHLVISPYPREYEKEHTLKDGRTVLLRPIRPEDEPMEEAMFRAFSKRTERFRFFQEIKTITHEMLVRYTQIDYEREIAIIAEIEEEGTRKMCGVVRLIADAYNDSAEFAIVVADPWQHQGLGGTFTDYILEIARKRNLRRVYAAFLKDNFIMRHMFTSRGFHITDQDDMYEAELILREE